MAIFLLCFIVAFACGLIFRQKVISFMINFWVRNFLSREFRNFLMENCASYATLAQAINAWQDYDSPASVNDKRRSEELYRKILLDLKK